MLKRKGMVFGIAVALLLSLVVVGAALAQGPAGTQPPKYERNWHDPIVNQSLVAIDKRVIGAQPVGSRRAR